MKEDIKIPKDNDNLVRHGGIMFSAVAVFNVTSLLYQLFMARNLSPADYGILNSLFSILMIVSIPSGSLQTVVAKFISIFYASKSHDKIRHLLGSFITKSSIFGLVIFAALFMGSKKISSFLQIDSPILIVILGAISFLSIILPLTQGSLQGLQQFGWLGTTMIINGSLKLLLGVIFVSIGFGVLGAISSLGISVLSVLVLSALILRYVSPKIKSEISFQNEAQKQAPDLNYKEIYKFLYITVTAFLCFMTLTNVDILLVKHYFTPVEAGYYSIAQMAGKIILFLPVAISIVMFPKSSELHAQSKTTLPLLKKCLIYVSLLCGMAGLVCYLFPDVIIKLMSGEENPECIPLIRIFSITMFFFALVYILIFYHLSTHCINFIFPLALLTIAQVILIVLFHETLSQILFLMCGNAIILFIINTYLAFKRKGSYAADGINSNS